MALVSGGKSTLNPNAPLYVPAAMRQVEDFSPEWYHLISTSTCFRDYWLSQHQEADMFYIPEEEDSGDIVDLLPDEIDLGIEDEEFLYMDSQFQEFAQSPRNQGNIMKQVDVPVKKLGFPEISFPAGSKFAVLPAIGK